MSVFKKIGNVAKGTVNDLERGIKHEVGSAKKEAEKVPEKSVEGETKKLGDGVNREGKTAGHIVDHHTEGGKKK